MTYAEKYEQVTAGQRRPLPGRIWLKNDAMTALNPDNPVLINVEEKQFTVKNSPYVKQGYTRYVHEKPVPAPVEAKKTPKKED